MLYSGSIFFLFTAICINASSKKCLVELCQTQGGYFKFCIQEHKIDRKSITIPHYPLTPLQTFMHQFVVIPVVLLFHIFLCYIMENSFFVSNAQVDEHLMTSSPTDNTCFLGAPQHLYNQLCLSVGRSVGRLVGQIL